MKLRGKLPPWATLALFLVLGLALIIIPHFFELRWDYGITPEIGIAFVVASILGFTIDRWMRAEIRRDVFLASIGHLLAPEFRAEVSRIVGYSLVCERHLLLIKIESVGNEVVRITSHVERAIRNRSAYPQNIKNITHIDEWGYQKAGAAEVIECILEIDGVPIDASDPKRNAYSVYRETREETLKPNQAANLRSKYIEYKPMHDDLHYSFASPTINPEIEVQVSDDLDCIYNFGAPSENAENVVVSKYAPRKQLIGRGAKRECRECCGEQVRATKAIDRHLFPAPIDAGQVVAQAKERGDLANINVPTPAALQYSPQSAVPCFSSLRLADREQ